MELGIESKMIIHEDNQACLKLIRNPENNKRSKHIAMKIHFVASTVIKNNIEVKYINTKEQKADGLTKGLNKILLRQMCQSVGLEGF